MNAPRTIPKRVRIAIVWLLFVALFVFGLCLYDFYRNPTLRSGIFFFAIGILGPFMLLNNTRIAVYQQNLKYSQGNALGWTVLSVCVLAISAIPAWRGQYLLALAGFAFSVISACLAVAFKDWCQVLERPSTENTHVEDTSDA